MPWIPHLMVLDDDPRVLDSLIPSFANDLAQRIGRSRSVGAAIRKGDPAGPDSGLATHVKISAHGFDSERLNAYRHRSPHHSLQHWDNCHRRGDYTIMQINCRFL